MAFPGVFTAGKPFEGLLCSAMKAIFFKDFRLFFTGLTGMLSIGVFLLLMGLFLFIFPDTSIFEYGYATMDKFFELAPWVLLLLVPAITMRSLSDELRTGTWELLRTRPLTLWQIVLGKFAAGWAVALLALVPTSLYVLTLQQLSIHGSIDGGGIAGAYIGLLLLTGIFTAVGVFCSSLTANPVIGFLTAAFVCFLLYSGFQSLSSLPALAGGADYYIQQLGIAYHYRNVSRGVVGLQDIVYFAGVAFAFLAATTRVLQKK